MKSIMKMSVWMMVIFMTSLGCERWGGRIDNLDSDRPTDVGSEFGKRGNGGTTDKGTIYGDLLYILRNEDGTPQYSNGFVQPLAFVNDQPFTDDGTVGVQYVCAINDEGEVIPNSYIDEGQAVEYHGDVGDVFGPKEVEFGRTSIFRSPQSVMDKAIREALNGLAEIRLDENNKSDIQLDFCMRLYGLRPDGTEKTVDSPRENIALYQSIMENEGFAEIMDICTELGYNHLYDFFYDWSFDNKWLHVGAGCFSAANDKTGTVHVDKVEYVNRFKNIIGINKLTDDENQEYFNYGLFIDYNRSQWNNVKIGFLVWNGDYNSEPIEILTVTDIFEGSGAFGYGTRPQFTYSSTHPWFKANDVGSFAQFADDCNQVLEYVHEDSNVIWVK